MAKLHSDLSEFVRLLNSHRVEYVIVGGHAVAYHGHPRFTGDIHFFIRATPENAARVVQALRDFGFGELQVNASDFMQPDRILQLGRPPNRIDILTSISGVEFEQAWLNRVRGKLGRRTVSFLGWDDLILNKKASGRDKDKLDVATLEAVAARR